MADLSKAIRSAMNTHINTNRGVYTMFEASALPDDPAQPCFEVRYIGPDVELQGSEHTLEFSVEILCVAPISSNIYAIDTLFDVVIAFLEMPISIDGDCFRLRGPIQVRRFGKIGRLYQGTVTAEYEVVL